MAAVVESRPTSEVPPGGGFLLAEVGSHRVVAPESFTEEQRLYYRTAQQFARERVLPRAEQIERKDNALLRRLLREAGDLGLLMIDIPEAYGGLGLDKTTSLLVAEAKSILGAWSSTFGAHTTIGTLPIVWYGTAAQKQKYLPKLANAEWVGAYALTETGSGSDALAAKTRAALSPDGKTYRLSGSKQFITNAGLADVFVVFAKVDGEKFTAFIVQRDTPGLTVGPEEHKMGIRGSSTCPLILEDAPVPIENVLGEIGKGHKIAFNILNVGRLKLGAGVVGGMKYQLEQVLRYAQERKQFNAPIFQFPLIRDKFARMAIATYAVESMAYRTSGLIDARLVGEDRAAPDYDRKTIAAIEEYAIEASILKVFGSEALGMLVDEAVQIHGGYGYIEDFPVERAYRDSRINRIFEGTNEINRLLISGMLLKRAASGGLPLFDFASAVEQELSRGQLPNFGDGDQSRETFAAECLKRLAVYPLKVAVEAHGAEIERRQEILAWVADVVMDAFALDSMIARTRQSAIAGKLDPARLAMARAFATEAMGRSYQRAVRALSASARGATLSAHLDRIAPMSQLAPDDPIETRELIVSAVELHGGYPIRWH
ncbi:MAG TPA: acyl-CoA dehydrogenase family protein [Myxococcaceae bacterium]|nr:acyl-CoA dehydrogenase family protein [Myxococcaceae bacterium]